MKRFITLIIYGLLLKLIYSVPISIPVSGYISTGATPFSGATNFQFNVISSNTSSSVWNLSTTLQVSNGSYAIYLSIPLNVLVPTNNYLLRTTVGGVPMVPDSPIASVPYAYYAGAIEWTNILNRPSGLDDGDDTGGNSGGWFTNGNNTYYTNGQVGIGNDIPQGLFSVLVNSNSYVSINGGALPSGTHMKLNSYHLGGFSSIDSYDYDANQRRDIDFLQSKVRFNANGNVGIGTTNASEKLEVIGNVKANQFIGDGSGLTNISSGSFVYAKLLTNLSSSTTFFIPFNIEYIDNDNILNGTSIVPKSPGYYIFKLLFVTGSTGIPRIDWFKNGSGDGGFAHQVNGNGYTSASEHITYVNGTTDSISVQMQTLSFSGSIQIGLIVFKVN